MLLSGKGRGGSEISTVKAAETSGAAAVRAGWLIDGTGAAIRKDVVLRTANGRIASIEGYKEYTGSSGPLSELIDLSSCTILPALIDAHAHLFMSGTTDRNTRDRQLDAPFEEIRPVIERHLCRLFDFGVVAVRDGGDRSGHTLRYRRECLEAAGVPVRVNAAGRAWHRPHRYGRLIGRSPQADMSLAAAIKQETDPVDHVKVVNSGLNSLLSFGRQTGPQFSVEEMKAGVAAAAGRGWGVMVHANGQIPVQIAVDAGCRSIEHGFFMGMENLKKMAERQIFWVPTAFTMKAYAGHLEHSGPETDVPQRNLDHQLEQMAAAKTFGVPLAVGTDAGSLGVHHGAGMVEEIRLFLEAGFSIAEAVRCATSSGAILLGLDGAGIIKPGAPATLIAIKGDPVGFPESLRDIRCMVVDGRILRHSRESRDFNGAINFTVCTAKNYSDST